jgi:hypothetical protein
MQSTLTRRVVTAVAITVGTVALVACVLVGAGASSSSASPQPTARGEYSLDFIRVLQLVADLRARPPAQPLVCLLGGSSARECTISNGSWSDRVSSLRGYRVKCVNLGSKHRLFTQDRRIVGYLPQGTDIVYVGVNAGRFCNGPYDPAVILPEPSRATASATMKGDARTSRTAATRASTKVLPDWRKRQIAEQWMVKRWPNFRKRWRWNLRALERVCRRSLDRGQHPVIIDLPRNMQIIGRLLDRPMRIYHHGCRDLADKLGIPYVQIQSRARLTNRDFSDLWHTVESGQIKWERELAATTARLIARYGFGPAPTPSPSPSAEPSPSGSPAPAEDGR